MSRRILAVMACSVTLVWFNGCKQSAPIERNHDADVRAIQDAESRWNDDFASRNVGRLMTHYASDATVMMPGEPVSSGPDAIRRALEHRIADPALALSREPAKLEVATSGDLAYTQGSYTLTATDPQTKQTVHDHGSYVTTYRKQGDGAWKAVAEIATSAVSPGAPGGPGASSAESSQSESVPKKK